MATVIPYSLAKTGTVLPDTTITIYLGIVLIAAVLTLAASLGTARRTIHHPAIQTIAID
jgi:putative ABC transport system permease protein